MTTFSLTPLFRHSVGFDRLDNMLDRVFDDKGGSSYPPYNIEKLADDKYQITMAIAGFSMDDINITVHGDLLTVTGEHSVTESDDEVQYLYRGIANRSFNRKFNLADHVTVTAAKMQDGLLKIQLQREIPEEAKPKQIEISGE